MGTWSGARSWSYHGINSGGSITKSDFASYTNTSSVTEYIKSITIRLATVNGTCSFGDTVTGQGGDIQVYLTHGSYTSNTQTVNTVVGVQSWTDGETTGNIPISSNAAEYTFTFSNPIPVSASSTAAITMVASSTAATVIYVSKSPSGSVDQSNTGSGGEDSGETETKTYTLTIDPNGGFYEGDNKAITIEGSPGDTVIIYSATQDGYTFGGWDVDGYGTYANDIFTFGNGDTTFTANWSINTYTLTINPNGGTWNGSTGLSQYSLQYKQTMTIPNPTRSGYNFSGWTMTSVNASFSNGVFTQGPGNATLTANWAQQQFFNLTINPNGGTMLPGGPDHKDEIYATAGGESTIVDVEEPYTIKFEYGKPRFLTDLYNGDDGDTRWVYYINALDISCCAYKIGHMNTGWEIVSGGGEVYLGDAGQALLPSATSYTDLTQHTTSDSEAYIFDGDYAGDVEIKAIFSPNQYRFTYDINLPADISEEEQDTITAPSISEYYGYDETPSFPVLPDLNNWSFVGWNLIPTATSQPINYEVSTLVLIYDLYYKPERAYRTLTNQTIPLYAVWAKKGMVNLYLNGEWKTAQVYIYTNDTDKWKRTIPYLYTSEWKQVTGG